MSLLSKNSLAGILTSTIIATSGAVISDLPFSNNMDYIQNEKSNYITILGEKNKTINNIGYSEYQYERSNSKIEMPFNNRVRSNIGNTNLSGKMVAMDYSEMGILEGLFCLENKQEIQTFFEENKALWPVVANKLYCGLRGYFETEEILLEVDEDKELFVGVKCMDSEETWECFDRFYNEWLLESYDELKGKIYVDVFVV